MTVRCEVLFCLFLVGGCLCGDPPVEEPCPPADCLDDYLFSEDPKRVTQGMFQLNLDKPFPLEPHRRERLMELAEHPNDMDLRVMAFLLGEQTGDLDIMVRSLEATSASPEQAATQCLADKPVKRTDGLVEPCSYWVYVASHCEGRDPVPEVCVKWGKSYLDQGEDGE